MRALVLAALGCALVAFWAAIGGVVALILHWGAGEVLCVELAALTVAVLTTAAVVADVWRHS